MKLLPSLLRSSSVLPWLVLPAVLTAATTSTTPANPAPDPAEKKVVPEETIELNPFIVNADRDVGFVATNALAGGRLNTALKDTPAPYSVLTHEFIDALNITDLTQAVQWGVNSTLTPDNGLNDIFGTLPTFNFRGVSTGTPNRNFFPFYVTYDSYNLDRYDFGRGPNSVLFGQGSLGGTLNAVTKPALLDRRTDEIRTSIGSWSNYRVTADVNQPIGRHLAIRTDLMWQDSKSWRDLDFTKKKGGFATATYEFTPATQIRAEAEYGEQSQLSSMTNITDRISGWDGKTTFNTLQKSFAPLATRNAQGFTQYSSDSYVYAPATGTDHIVNYQYVPVTIAASTSGTYIGGKPVVGSASINAAANPILFAGNLPADRYSQALQGSPSFRIPSTKFTTSFNAPKFTQRFKDLALYFDHNIGDSIFLEVAADINSEHRFGDTSYNRNFTETFIDLNANLPTGAANPRFLQPYNEASRYYNYRDSETRNLRVAAAYVKDTRWFKFTGNLLAGINNSRGKTRADTLQLPLDDDLRVSPGKHLIRYRLYWDQPDRSDRELSGPMTVDNPLTGVTQTMTPIRVADTTRATANAGTTTNNRYAQFSTNLRLFHGRLNLLGALRRDGYYVISRQTKVSGDLAAGWNGRDIVYKPDAPSDYYALSYVQKDTTGKATSGTLSADTRPRDSNGFASPQYSGDRFRDDYNPPAVHGAVTTYSIGGVYNVTKWLGIYGNVAETFTPPSAITTFDGSLLPPTSARGVDFGLRLTPLDGRVSINIGVYRSTEDNYQVTVPSGFGSFNTIYQTPPGGSTASRNIRGVADLPVDLRDTVVRQANGVEFELTANLTKHWRMLTNLAYARAFQSDAYPNLIHYLATQDAVLRQILKDAGVVISSSNFATVDTSGVPTATNAQNAANAWNNIQTNLVANLVTGRQKLTGSTEVTGNVYTDYSFSSGWLRGWRVGGGINYRGRQVLGFRGGDTKVDPANSSATIDDPTVDAYTTVFSSPYYTGTATLGYTYRFKRGYTLITNLQVGNLFNRRQPVYIAGVVQRPPNGDISSPARVATPYLYYYLQPLSFNLTTTLKF